MYPLEVVEVIILSISSGLATACGIGGGTVYSSFLLGVQEFDPMEAFPISNCLILACGLVTFFACVLDKKKHPKNKFVDYDMVIIFGPSMLLGAKIGTIFNKIFSTQFLTVSILLVLFYSIFSTYRNIKKAKKRELAYKNQLEEDKKEPLIPKSASLFLLQASSERGSALNPSDMEILREDENPLRMDRISFVLIIEVLIIIDQLLEGNSRLPSFVGVIRCSYVYWLIFIGYIAISILLIKIAYFMVKSHLAKRKRIDPEFKDEKMANLSDNVVKVVCIAIVAGIISSMVGIGGGMITNPLFASLGLDPKESSSTSNFLIITTAIATTFLFSFAGQLNYMFAIWLMIPCTAFAFLGSFYIFEYINKTHKSSILLVIMLYFLIASMFIIFFKGYMDLDTYTIKAFFTINSYC